MTRSPARTTAPPRSAASTELRMRTRRLSRCSAPRQLLGLSRVERHRRDHFDVHGILDRRPQRPRNAPRFRAAAAAGDSRPARARSSASRASSLSPATSVMKSASVRRRPTRGFLMSAVDARDRPRFRRRPPARRPGGEGIARRARTRTPLSRRAARWWLAQPRATSAASLSSRSACALGSISRPSRREAPSTASSPTSRRSAFAGARGLERHLLARAGNQPLRLGRGGALGLLDHLVRALARLIDESAPRGRAPRGRSPSIAPRPRSGPSRSWPAAARPSAITFCRVSIAARRTAICTSSPARRRRKTRTLE